MKPIRLFWLECVESDLPLDESWLADAEIACVRKTWAAKRRRDWLLGRWTAKCAVAAHLGIVHHAAAFRSLAIVPEETGAPRLLVDGEVPGLSLSISHRDGRALAVISSQTPSVGCDLERCEPRSPAFVEQMLTPSEVEQVEQLHAVNWAGIETLIWSAKESVLKLLALGLRVDSRYVSVQIHALNEAVTGWQKFSAAVADGTRFAGWWCRDWTWIRTIASWGEPSTPVRLNISNARASRVS